jgi:hypothetical protein
MRHIFSLLWMAALTTVMVAISAFPAFAEPPRTPEDILREIDASNVGICSVEWGRQGLRDDAALRLVEVLDIPGALYSARAQERGGDEDCIRR